MGEINIEQQPLVEQDVNEGQSYSHIGIFEELTVSGLLKVGVKDAQSRVVLDGTTGRLRFTYDQTPSGSIWCDSSLNMVYWAETKHFFQDIDGSTGFAEIGSDGIVFPSGKSIFFTGGTTITDTGSTMQIDRTTEVDGDVALSTGKKFQVGTGALTAGIDYSNASVNTFSINIVGGIVTQFTKNS